MTTGTVNDLNAWLDASNYQRHTLQFVQSRVIRFLLTAIFFNLSTIDHLSLWQITHLLDVDLTMAHLSCALDIGATVVAN